jgi:hypothetical protein
MPPEAIRISPNEIASELFINGYCITSTTMPKPIASIPFRVINHQFLNSLICIDKRLLSKNRKYQKLLCDREGIILKPRLCNHPGILNPRYYLSIL